MFHSINMSPDELHECLDDASEPAVMQVGAPNHLMTLMVEAKSGTWSVVEAGAMANWQLFAEDWSFGVHNPDYAFQVLTNTIEALTAFYAGN